MIVTPDDLLKLVFALLLGGLGTICGWLLKSVLYLKERIVQLDGRIVQLGDEARRVESSLKEDREERVTVDHVREVIEEALEKRDRVAEARRVEWDKLHALEVERAIREQLAELVPFQTSQMEGMVRKVVQEIRGCDIACPLEHTGVPPQKSHPKKG